MTSVSFFVTAITISYIVGGLIIDRKIWKSDANAKAIYRTIVTSDNFHDYMLIVKCAYLGGDEYENLLLDNSKFLKIILENERREKTPY